MRMQDVQSGSRHSDLRAVILTGGKFEDMELFVSYFRPLDEGVRVDIAAPTMDDIGGEHGYRIAPDLLIDDLNPDDYDLLVIPGGFPDGAASAQCSEVSCSSLSAQVPPRRDRRLGRPAPGS